MWFTEFMNFRLVAPSIPCILEGETALFLSVTLQHMSFLLRKMIYRRRLHPLHQGDLMKEKLSASSVFILLSLFCTGYDYFVDRFYCFMYLPCMYLLISSLLSSSVVGIGIFLVIPWLFLFFHFKTTSCRLRYQDFVSSIWFQVPTALE